MNKLPLVQRLEPDNPYAAVAQLGFAQLRDFFLSLEELRADGHYSDVYYSIVLETLESLPTVPDDSTMFDDRPASPGDGEPKDGTLFAEAVTMIINLPRKERANLLYHVMIEPFT